MNTLLMSVHNDQPNEEDYLRLSCNHILQAATSDSDSERFEPATSEGDQLTVVLDEQESSQHRRRAASIRVLALLCACSLSVGSHYASNILGPLKSRLQRELGTSNTEFGLLLSAYNINSTWTPLIGGILASRLGTTFTSILATGVIFLGQFLLLCGDIWKNVGLMTVGLFIFGLGVSPLAVVQETIIVRFFKSHGLGVSMAFGLIAGKVASFISARTSYPLTERFGPHAPFYISTCLALLSVIINLVYVASSRWFVDGAGAELEAPDISHEARRRLAINLSEAQALKKVAEKRKVYLSQIANLGDVFWAYMCFNFFYGMIWSPFTHLSANIIERRYHMSERDAANTSSYLLAGSIVLYPLCGYIVDRLRHRPIIIQLLLLSSFLTMGAYSWFVLPPTWTKTPLPGISLFAIGHGFSPLLLVVLVPTIVHSKYISTALGAHKSLEQTGAAIFQTLSGILLDTKGPENKWSDTALQYLLDVFLIINVLACFAVLLLVYLRRSKLASSRSRLSSTVLDSPRTRRISSGELQTSEQETPLLTENHSRYSSTDNRTPSRTRFSREISKSEVQRGKIMSCISATLIAAAWILFMATAWVKLGQPKGAH
ncbi:MFS general substrate transporter [Phlegmacium glaucopus]|nr:MFS general substrate transporter [Phlegmacium glaucopus]